MNRQLYIHTLKGMRDVFQAEHMDTQVEALEAAIEALEKPTDGDCISRKDVLSWLNDEWDGMVLSVFDGIRNLPSAQPEDYAEMKQEFLRMASYIDVLLQCSDEQKETLLGFISRMSEFMPWNERD